MSLGLTGDEDLDGVRGPAKAPVRDGGPPRMDSSVIRFAMVAAVAVHVESPKTCTPPRRTEHLKSA